MTSRKRKRPSPTPPPGDENRLQDMHPCPRDSRISFEPVNHVYTVDWDNDGETESNSKSVSSVVGQYFPRFDASCVIERMKRSKKWNTPSHKYWGMTDTQIKNQWRKNGTNARDRGTSLHDRIEKHLCSYSPPPNYDNSKLMSFFMDFMRDHTAYTPYRCEWRLFTDRRSRITGTPDFVAVSRSHNDSSDTLLLTIFDWKCSGAIKRWSPWNENGTGPCEGLPSVNYNKYALQQSFYATILENHYEGLWFKGKKYTRTKVDKLYLIVFHEKNRCYHKIQVPFMRKRVQEMIEIEEKKNNDPKKKQKQTK